MRCVSLLFFGISSSSYRAASSSIWNLWGTLPTRIKDWARVFPSRHRKTPSTTLMADGSFPSNCGRREENPQRFFGRTLATRNSSQKKTCTVVFPQWLNLSCTAFYCLILTCSFIHLGVRQTKFFSRSCVESWGHFKSGWNPTCLSAIKLVAASFDSIDDLQSTDNDSLSLWRNNKVSLSLLFFWAIGCGRSQRPSRYY